MLLAMYGVISFLRVKNNKLEDDEHPTVVMSKRNYFGLMVKGFLLNFINIGVLGFWLVILISAGPALDMDSDRLLLFFGGILSTYLITDIFKILLAKKLRSKLTPTRISIIKRSISVLMFVFGLILISKGMFPAKIEQIEKRIEEIAPETQFNIHGDSITL